MVQWQLLCLWSKESLKAIAATIHFVPGFSHTLIISTFAIIFTFWCFEMNQETTTAELSEDISKTTDISVAIIFPALLLVSNRARMSAQTCTSRVMHGAHMPESFGVKLKPCDGPNVGRPVCFAHNYSTSPSQWSWGTVFVASDSLQLKSSRFSCVPSAAQQAEDTRCYSAMLILLLHHNHPSLIRLQLIQIEIWKMKNAVHSWMHNFGRLMSHLSVQKKTWALSSHLHYYVEK
jgi:hypothetical protein